MGVDLPLAGIRIVDFSWAIVGNTATKLLGDFGADVFKIEAWSRISMERARDIVPNEDPTSPDNKQWYAQIATSKKSVTPELKDPRGRKFIEDLVRESDVVVENFSPGTITRMGFGYEKLRELNPRIILASGSIFGQSGPDSHFPGVDATGAARSGRIAASGYPDGRQLLPGSTYGDSVLPFYICAGILGALDRREKTGEGCWIDGAMVEVQVQQMWPLLADVLAGKEQNFRTGNRHPYAAPHNIYPAAGDDRWIAIEVWTDEEWRSLCATIGRDELADDPRFATLADRKANEDALDAAIDAWTSTREPDAAMQELQAAGVAAGTVRTTGEVVDLDPQLKHRGFLQQVPHPVLGNFLTQRTPIELSEGGQQMTHAPLLGQHNRSVAASVLGMDKAAFDALQADGVFGPRDS